jgi:two-component system sensor histidine kinase PhoQ
VTQSITRRLLISQLVILGAFLGLAGAALDRAFRASNEIATRDQLQAHVYTLLTAAKEDPQGRMRLPEALAAAAFNNPDSGLYAEVEGEDGAYHWRSGSLVGRPQPLSRVVDPGTTRFHFAPRLAIFDQGIVWEDDAGTPLAYSLTVAMDRQALDAQQAGFRSTLWRWLGGVAVLLLMAQILAARWGLAPVREMSAAVRRIENGEAERVEGPVPLEMRSLSNNLNSLLQENQRRQERVRNSLADLAHSMKTPLAVLRGAAQESDDGALSGLIEEQTERIDQIVSYQRQRAAVAGGSRATRPIALTPILRRLTASLDKVYWERALQIDVQAASDLHLRADEGDLFELLGNLLENAYKHAMRKVRVHAQRQGRELQIDIEDDGQGIPKGDMSRLLQRGERADQRSPGEGIGLAVANEIVHQYGGAMSIHDSALGGALFRVSLPVG